MQKRNVLDSGDAPGLIETKRTSHEPVLNYVVTRFQWSVKCNAGLQVNPRLVPTSKTGRKRIIWHDHGNRCSDRETSEYRQHRLVVWHGCAQNDCNSRRELRYGFSCPTTESGVLGVNALINPLRITVFNPFIRCAVSFFRGHYETRTAFGCFPHSEVNQDNRVYISKNTTLPFRAEICSSSCSKLASIL